MKQTTVQILWQPEGVVITLRGIRDNNDLALLQGIDKKREFRRLKYLILDTTQASLTNITKEDFSVAIGYFMQTTAINKVIKLALIGQMFHTLELFNHGIRTMKLYECKWHISIFDSAYDGNEWCLHPLERREIPKREAKMFAIF